MNPKISVITVSFNARLSIERTIQSVLDQKYTEVEYIIIDGKSSDGTQSVVEKYSDKITKFISEPDSGIYNAMNKGIKMSEGDYIYFLNADDYLIDKYVLIDVADFISRNNSPKFVYGNLEIRSSRKPLNFVSKSPQPDQILEELICGCLPHQASFAHRDLFADPMVGLFNENYKTGADYEWFIKVASAFAEDNKQIKYYDRVIASYNEEGASGNMDKMSSLLTEKFTIQNAMPIYQSEYWLKLRIDKYQKIIINPEGKFNLFRHSSSKVQSMVMFVELLPARLKSKKLWSSLLSVAELKIKQVYNSLWRDRL